MLRFRLFDRTVRPIPERPTTGLRYRIETLTGITGVKMAKYRVSWLESVISPLNVVWRPHLLMVLVFEVITLVALQESWPFNDFLSGRQWCSDLGLVSTYNDWLTSCLYILIALSHQVTNAVFLGTPPPTGFAWGPFAIAGGYATPIVRYQPFAPELQTSKGLT